jgi:hypothetical protein
LAELLSFQRFSLLRKNARNFPKKPNGVPNEVRLSCRTWVGGLAWLNHLLSQKFAIHNTLKELIIASSSNLDSLEDDDCPFHRAMSGLRFDITSHGYAATGDLLLKVYAQVLDHATQAKPEVVRSRAAFIFIIADRLIEAWVSAGLFHDDSTSQDSDFMAGSSGGPSSESTVSEDEGIAGEEIAAGLSNKMTTKNIKGKRAVTERASRTGEKLKKAKVSLGLATTALLTGF